MDYEKKYKEALEWMKDVYPTLQGAAKKEAEKYFPEIVESEDEQIRKWCISYFRECFRVTKDNVEYQEYLNNKVIPWLERQGEPEPVVIIPKFRVGDIIRPKGSMAEYTIESISGECYHGKGWGLHISCDDDYELVKQKPAWSEEDEKIYNRICDIVHNAAFTNYDVDEDGKECGEYAKIIGWFKDLKDRVGCEANCTTMWEPSDEELKALKEAVYEHFGIDGVALWHFYQDLKKLREK